MKGDIHTKTPVIISAQRQADPDGDQEGSAILWLVFVLFSLSALVVLCSATFCALQVVQP